MTLELTNAEKIRLLPWHIALNATNTIFAQFTFFGSAFVLFTSALGASNTQIGFLLSLLPFFGVVAVVIAPRVARFGYKRTYLMFFGIRKVITAGLLLVPWVLAEFGPEAALTLVSLIVMGFALCRAIAETGIYPWMQEFIPNSIRGKHSAVNDMVSRVTGMLALAVGGYILGLSEGLDRFMLLFGVAVLFGFAAVWSATHIPGGAPTRASAPSYGDLLAVLRDRNFGLYMLGLSLATFGAAPLAFLPLFLQNQVGLNDSMVVWLQIGTILGGFSATYLLGWAADRYGSKPVMLSGLYLRLLLPVGWLLMPRNSELSLAIALGIAIVWGVAEIAWLIGSTRLLFVKVVPSDKKTQYMAMFYALIGIVGGVSQIISGQLLDVFSGLSGRLLFLELDPFTPLFIGVLVLTALSALLYRSVQADSTFSLGEFAGMFTHGNPVMALESLVRYYRAADERAAVALTERLGQTRSPLTVDELLEALKDPRFNVRFEAIIAMTRMGPEPRLVSALCHILDGTELSLSNVAAWALGRMGSPDALPTLRAALDSPYRSVQAHAARALGTLRDASVAPLLLERLQTETDKGLRIAYASALGNLRHAEALDTLFNVLDATENQGARLELALAIARIGGDEQVFVRLLRQTRQDTATTAAQAVMAVRRRTERRLDAEQKALLNACAEHFAAGRLDEGAAGLCAVIGALPTALPGIDLVRGQILSVCCAQLQAHGSTRMEYLLLALDMLS